MHNERPTSDAGADFHPTMNTNWLVVVLLNYENIFFLESLNVENLYRHYHTMQPIEVSIDDPSHLQLVYDLSWRLLI